MCLDVVWIQWDACSPHLHFFFTWVSLLLLPFSPRCDSDCHSLLLWEALSHLSQSGRKECFTPGLQSCACQRRVCNPPPTLVSADLLFSSDMSTPVCSCLWALCRTWPRDGTGACTDVCRVFTGKNGDNNRNLKCFDALKKTRGVICSEITEHSHDRHVSNFSFCTVRFVSGLSCWFLRILSAAQCVFVSSSSLSLEVFKSQIRVCWREAAGKGRESAVPFVLQHGC